LSINAGKKTGEAATGATSTCPHTLWYSHTFLPSRPRSTLHVHHTLWP